MTTQVISKESLLKRVFTAWETFNKIESADDIERFILRGQGLSKSTYHTYRQAFMAFYKFTQKHYKLEKGLHPLQVSLAEIETFYDDRVKEVDVNTACLEIQGLKKFFASVEIKIPGYESPFREMPEKLKEKLNRVKNGNRKKKPLSKTEVHRLLAWLEQKKDVKGLENYAMVYMLVTSGLRAFELCQLRWGDIECYNGQWIAYFTGKGNKDAEQELYKLAIDASRRYFKKAFGRNPKYDDILFWTVPSYHGDIPRPLPYHSLWRRITEIGEKAKAKAKGIVRASVEFSPHLFRRTYASLLEAEGMPGTAIQKKTRHSSFETLEKYYLNNEMLATPFLDKCFALQT